MIAWLPTLALFFTPAHAAEVCVLAVTDVKPALEIDRCYCNGMEVKDARFEEGIFTLWAANRQWARQWTIDPKVFAKASVPAEQVAQRARQDADLQICCGYSPRDSNTCVQIATRVIPKWAPLGGPVSAPGTISIDVGTAGARF